MPARADKGVVGTDNQLTPAGAWLMGAAFVICGAIPILIAQGIITPAPSPDNAPPWVAFCAGMAFITAGICIVVDYGIAGVTMQPNGDFADGTPMAIRVANLVLGGIIVGSMTAMFGWVAFGSGPRHFTTTIYLPFVPAPFQERAGDMSGRIIFGFGTILMAFMFVACTIVGVKRLLRSGRSDRSDRSSR